MRKLFCIIAVICIQINAFSQSVYNIDIKRDIIIGAVSLGVGITPFFINNEPGEMPAALDKSDVNGFDRLFMFSSNRSLDLFSDYFYTVALASLPVISVIPNVKDKNTILTYGIMYSQSLLLTYGTVFSLKNAIIRYRPYMYDSIPDEPKNDYHDSFPSSATAFSFLSATFLSTTFSHEFSGSKWRLPLIAGAYTLAAGTGVMRIASGAHYLTDVLTGAAIGSLYGWIIPRLHLNNKNKNHLLVPTGNGIMLSLKF